MWQRPSPNGWKGNISSGVPAPAPALAVLNPGGWHPLPLSVRQESASIPLLSLRYLVGSWAAFCSRCLCSSHQPSLRGPEAEPLPLATEAAPPGPSQLFSKGSKPQSQW